MLRLTLRSLPQPQRTIKQGNSVVYTSHRSFSVHLNFNKSAVSRSQWVEFVCNIFVIRNFYNTVGYEHNNFSHSELNDPMLKSIRKSEFWILGQKTK